MGQRPLGSIALRIPFPAFFLPYATKQDLGMMRQALFTLLFLVWSTVLFAGTPQLWRTRLGEGMSVDRVTELRARGIEVVDYLGAGEYLVQSVSRSPKRVAAAIGVSSVPLTPFSAQEKLSPALKREAATLSLRVIPLPQTREEQMRETLLSLGGTFVSYDPLTPSLACLLPNQAVEALAAQPWVLWVHPAPRPRKALDYTSKQLSSVPLLEGVTPDAPYNLTGANVRLGIWDETLDPHPDLRGRYTQEEQQLESSGHGTHVAGIILGAGYDNPTARGIAPRAHAWCYNFREDENGPEREEWEEMARAHRDYHISLTNNSYGIAYEEKSCADYKEMVYDLDAPYDRVAHLFPLMTHLFAVGNERNIPVCQSKFQSGYGSTPSRGKNLLYIGAVAADRSMTDFSSWGPTDDGRLLPTVVAHGAQVLSTKRTEGYIAYSGTSMATPVATGVLALATEFYAQQHAGDVPRSDLLRALAANGADDLFAPGPDYTSGYGLINAPNMIEMLRQGCYHLGRSASQGERWQQEIAVPAGTTRVRLMLVWNDAVSFRPHRWGDVALINDLDLRVTSNEGLVFPWTLNPKLPSAPAARGEDHLNNIEQVTIDAPTGTLRVEVVAHALPKPAQDWALVWFFERDAEPAFRLPRAGQVVGKTMPVAIDGLTYPIRLEFLQGAETLSKITLQRPLTQVLLPTNLRGDFRLRATDAYKNTLLSPQLHALPIPTHLAVKEEEGGLVLSWDAVSGLAASAHYSVKMSCGASDPWQEIAQVSTPQCTLPLAKLFGATQVALAVNVVVDGKEGALSEPVRTASLPALRAGRFFFEKGAGVNIAATVDGTAIVSGTSLPVGTTVRLEVETDAGSALGALWVNQTPIDFTRERAGHYVAQYTLPHTGLHPTFRVRARTQPTERPEVRLRLTPAAHGQYVVLRGGDTLRDGARLTTGTWLRFLHPEWGRFQPSHFLLNGKRLEGFSDDDRLFASLYRVAEDYALPDLQVGCAYTELPTRPLRCLVRGGEAEVECFTNGAPIEADSLCVQGAPLEIGVRVAEGYVLDKMRCDGKLLQVVRRGGWQMGSYTVPTTSAAPLRVELILRVMPTSVEEAGFSSLSLSPQPFSDRLRIASQEPLTGRYELVTLTGIPVRSGALTGTEHWIETEELPAGVYFVRFYGVNSLVKVVRVIKY